MVQLKHFRSIVPNVPSIAEGGAKMHFWDTKTKLN